MHGNVCNGSFRPGPGGGTNVQMITNSISRRLPQTNTCKWRPVLPFIYPTDNKIRISTASRGTSLLNIHEAERNAFSFSASVASPNICLAYLMVIFLVVFVWYFNKKCCF